MKLPFIVSFSLFCANLVLAASTNTLSAEIANSIDKIANSLDHCQSASGANIQTLIRTFERNYDVQGELDALRGEIKSLKSELIEAKLSRAE